MHPTWTLIIVVVLAVLLFSRPGKLSGLMEDLGKGIGGFRKGMEEGKQQASNPPPAEPPRAVPDQSSTTNSQDRVQN